MRRDLPQLAACKTLAKARAKLATASSSRCLSSFIRRDTHKYYTLRVLANPRSPRAMRPSLLILAAAGLQHCNALAAPSPTSALPELRMTVKDCGSKGLGCYAVEDRSKGAWVCDHGRGHRLAQRAVRTCRTSRSIYSTSAAAPWPAATSTSTPSTRPRAAGSTTPRDAPRAAREPGGAARGICAA